MGFVKYISYEYRRKWLRAGFISTTVNYYFIYLLWSSTMVGCNDYIVVLLDGYAIF